MSLLLKINGFPYTCFSNLEKDSRNTLIEHPLMFCPYRSTKGIYRCQPVKVREYDCNIAVRTSFTDLFRVRKQKHQTVGLDFANAGFVFCVRTILNSPIRNSNCSRILRRILRERKLISVLFWVSRENTSVSSFGILLGRNFRILLLLARCSFSRRFFFPFPKHLSMLSVCSAIETNTLKHRHSLLYLSVTTRN